MTELTKTSCWCNERNKPIAERKWTVGRRKYNESAFNGGHRTPSKYSDVICSGCGTVWRSKAAYVDKLPDADLEALGRELTGEANGG